MASNDTVRTQIRLPEDLAARLRASAEQLGRSLNSEMVQRLESSFNGPRLEVTDREGESTAASPEDLAMLRIHQARHVTELQARLLADIQDAYVKAAGLTVTFDAQKSER